MSGDPARLTIDIWSDVMCPWCIVGYVNLQKALVELQGEVAAEIRWHPFELNPSLPQEGEDLRTHMLRKYGQEPPPEGTGPLAQIAERIGYDMHYMGEGEPPPRRIWNTLKAHKLLRWALVSQGAEAQTRLKLALFDAHFQQRRNISDPATLLAIAAQAGLDTGGAAEAMDDEELTAAIRGEEREAMERGFTSVPTMVVEGRYVIQGGQEPDVFAASLRRIAALRQNAA